MNYVVLAVERESYVVHAVESEGEGELRSACGGEGEGELRSACWGE